MKFLLFTLLLAVSAASGAFFMTTTNNWLTKKEQVELKSLAWRHGAAFMDETWIDMIREQKRINNEALGFALGVISATSAQQEAINNGMAIYQEGARFSDSQVERFVNITNRNQ